jgi:HAD superfamily hydrolase (TIGR01662 family)
MPEIFDVILFDGGDTLFYFNGNMAQVLHECNLALIDYLSRALPELDTLSFLAAFEKRMNAYYNERENEFVEYTTAYILNSLLAEWGYEHLPQEILDQAVETMYRISQQYWIPEADAVPTLAELRQRGYRMGVVSNASDDRDVKTLLEKTGVIPYLDVIVTSAAAGIRKPNPRIFQAALANWNVPPKRAAMVGDTLGADILGAHNAGLYAIWLTRHADRPDNRDHLDTIQPDAQVDTLSQLLDIFK